MNTFEKVKEILLDNMDDKTKEITPDSELVSDLGISSLDLVSVVIAFEEAFDVEVPDREILEFRTAGDIISWLEKTAS